MLIKKVDIGMSFGLNFMYLYMLVYVLYLKFIVLTLITIIKVRERGGVTFQNHKIRRYMLNDQMNAMGTKLNVRFVKKFIILN